jgi:hypothetical protein
MGRVVAYRVNCDAAGETYGHTGDHEYVPPPPTLPEGWVVAEKDGETRRFHSANEADQWINGTLPDEGAPVPRPVELRIVYSCDWPANHPGGVEEFDTSPNPPPGWVVLTLPDGTPGFYDSVDCARDALEAYTTA